MDPLAPASRRPRPVAGLPALDPRAVAKAWLIELVAASSLEDAVGLPAELAQEGPGLAGAVVEALGDDTALRRLAPGGNLAWLSARAATFTGAPDPAAAVRATEALRRAVQASVLAEARLDAATTAELADRLAHVCAVVAEAAAAERAPSAGDDDADADADAEADASGDAAAGPPTDPEPEGAGASPPPQAADPRPPRLAAPEGEVVALHGGADALRARHERGAEPGSCEAAVQRRLERHAHDGSPFALLAIEADGAERLLAAQQDGEVDALLEALERSLAAELRPADQLLRDAPGRYWVTAPDTGPAVGRLLAERLADAARAAASHRGAPLTVSIGVATCPEDGEDVDTLGAHADQAMFRARAAGMPVA